MQDRIGNTLIRDREDAAKRCLDSGTLVYPADKSRVPNKAWCPCCGRIVRTITRDEETGRDVTRYAEHRLGSTGTVREPR